MALHLKKLYIDDHGSLTGLLDDDHPQYLKDTGDIGVGDYTFDGAVIINESGADKDFRVEGLSQSNLIVTNAANNYVGIGIIPTENFHIYKADNKAMFVKTEKTDANLFLTGTRVEFEDSAGGTKGFNGFQGVSSHSGAGGIYTQNQTGFDTTLSLTGSAIQLAETRNFNSQLYIRQATGNYTANKLASGIFIVTTALDTGGYTHTITDIMALGASAGDGWSNSNATWNVTNMTGIDIDTNLGVAGATVNITNVNGIYIRDPFQSGVGTGIKTNISGIKIDIPTSGTNKYGINLNGDGAGADIVMGAGQDAKIYYNGANLIIDPNVIGTGKVLIGATENDDLGLENIEIHGYLKTEADLITDIAPVDDTTQKKLSIQKLAAPPTNAAYIAFANNPGADTFYLVMEEA